MKHPSPIIRWSLLLGFSFAVIASPAAAVQRQTAEHAAVPNVYAFGYLLYQPPTYDADPSASWPLLVFLHGSGQRGTDLEVVAMSGPPLMIEQGRDFPGVVVSPQCSGSWWDSAALEAFIHDLIVRYRIDPDRVYLTGLSMGGYGTWDLAVRHPETYAAIAPLCGAGTPSLGYRLIDLPVWAFHGALDATVPVAGTQDMIAAIRQAGGHPQVTIYPDLGHDVWTVTYANNDLYTWLFAQDRANVPAKAPAVITPPIAQAVSAGQSVTWTVAATGNPLPGFQWQRRPSGSDTWENLAEGGNFSGTTTPTLTISRATPAMSGDDFRCVVTNTGGTVASDAARLSVSGGASALLLYPDGIASDNQGNLYVADGANNTIEKITSSGIVSTLAGKTGTAGSQDGTGSGALFNRPGGLAVDGAGNVFVADTGNATVRRISPGGAVTTVAGSPVNRGSRDGAGSGAWFSQPGAVAVDAAGNLYVTDSLDATLRKIGPDGTVSTLAGAAGIRGDADGTGTAARFNHPIGVAVDSAGNVYLADTYNDTIRRISPAGVATTLAGSAGLSGATDLTGANALLNQPAGLTVDAAGNVYVADTGNATIRRIDPAGAVTTVAGAAGVAGLCDTGNGVVLFNQPQALAIDLGGNLLVADTGNGVIRRISLAGTVSTLALAPAPNNPPTSGGGGNPPSDPAGGGSGGGGGAPSWGFCGALILLAAVRRLRPRRR